MNQRQQGMEIHVNFACCVLAACACCYFAVRLMFGTDAEIGGGDVFTVFLESERNARSQARRPTNEMTPLGVLMSRPTSSLLIAANLLIFIMLRRYRVPPDAVAIGLVDVVERREYWRCATSSLSHFDNWHIAMNMLSLWNVSALEDIVGSFRFAMGTAAAAAVAEFVACCALSLSRHNSSGRRVGFSGVLFSWVVVAAVAMPKYCVFGNACFTTFQFLYARLNIGPLFLAAAIQLVVPRASLTGHAAGIAVGFPLAWGFLDYLTPPVIATLLALIDAYLVDSPCSLSLRSTSAAILQTLAGTLCILYFPREHASSILAATNLAAALSSLVSTTRGNHTSLLLLPLVHALAFAGLAGTIQSRTSHHTAAIAAAAAHGTTALLFAQDHPRCFATIPPDVGGPVGKRVAVALRVIDALSIGPRECSLSRLAQKPSVTYSGAGNLHVPQEQKEPQSKTTRAPPSDNLDRA